jgi:hypothetical protein
MKGPKDELFRRASKADSLATRYGTVSVYAFRQIGVYTGVDSQGVKVATFVIDFQDAWQPPHKPADYVDWTLSDTKLIEFETKSACDDARKQMEESINKTNPIQMRGYCVAKGTPTPP